MQLGNKDKSCLRWQRTETWLSSHIRSNSNKGGEERTHRTVGGATMASAPVLEEQRLNQKWNRIRTSPVKLLFLSTFLINVVETKLNLYQVSISAPSCSLFLLVERIKYNLSVCIINFPSWGGELKKRLEWRVSTHFDLRSFFFFSFCRFVFCENQTRIKKHLHLAVFAWSSWESRHYPGEHSRLLLSCSTFAFPSPNVTTRSKNKKPKTFGGVETCVCVWSVF